MFRKLSQVSSFSHGRREKRCIALAASPSAIMSDRFQPGCTSQCPQQQRYIAFGRGGERGRWALFLLCEKFSQDGGSAQASWCFGFGACPTRLEPNLHRCFPR